MSEQNLKEEIAFLKQQLEVVADGVTEQKYLQQAKKLRELSVKLDSEKARVAKLQQTIIKHERQNAERSEAERKGVLLPSSSGNNNNNINGRPVGGPSSTELELQHAVSQLNDNKSKLDRTTAQNASFRAQIEKFDRDMNKIKKLLIAEIGDEGTVEKLWREVVGGGGGASASSNNNINNNNDDNASIVSASNTNNNESIGFRGRAQQISLLQSKVKDLNRKLNENNTMMNNSEFGGDGNSSVAGGGVAPSVITHVTASGVSTTIKDYDATHRSAIAQQESKKSAEVRQLQQNYEESKEQTAKEKQRADALSSRVHVLEKQLQQLRSSLQQVIQKTENDNKLIDAYKQELDTQRSEIRQLSLTQGNNNSKPALQAGSQSVAGYHQQYPNMGGGSNNPINNGSKEEDVRKIRSLESEVANLQRQISTMASSSTNNNNEENNNNSNAVVVESQRKMILNLEQQLQNAENKIKQLHQQQQQQQQKASSSNNNNTSPSKNNTSNNVINNNNNTNNSEQLQNLRDENASLKERMSALTSMVEREVEMKKAQLQAKYDQMMMKSNGGGNSKQQTQVQEQTKPKAAVVVHKHQGNDNNNNTNAVPSNQRGSAIVAPSTTKPVARIVRSDNNNNVQKQQPQPHIQRHTISKKETTSSDEDDDGNDAPPEHHDSYDNDDDIDNDYHENRNLASQRRRNNNNDDDDEVGEIPGAVSSQAMPLSLIGL